MGGRELPQAFGNYSILEHLATGGMAEVYLARKVGLQGFEKFVVIKRIRPELTHDVQTMGLFLDEARLVATLEHPNIAQVYEIERVSESYFIVMEYVQGADLRQMMDASLNTRRRISLDDAVYIISHVCAALHYAHEKRDSHGAPLDIIHRDISPSNVLVSHDGAVKVCDFGIARGRNRTTETAQGVLKGKLSYMSPEQCKSEPLDRHSDIFAIGILLYELSTLTKLFAAASEFELLRTIIEDPIPPPSRRLPGYPDMLAEIVMRALAKRPEDRYPTAQAMQVDLETFAREQKLKMSSINIARLMGSLFEKPSGNWRVKAHGFSQHDADTDVSTAEIPVQAFPTDPGFVVTPAPVGRVPSAAASTSASMAGPDPDTEPAEIPRYRPPASDRAPRVHAEGSAPGARTPSAGTPSGSSKSKAIPEPEEAEAKTTPKATLETPARRPRPSPLWLVGAVLVGGASLATIALQSKLTTTTDGEQALRMDVERLASTIDSTARASQLEVGRVAASPMLRAAIGTDAATFHDLATNEHALAAAPSEVLEIFQVRDGVASSLIRLPADGAPIALPKRGQVQLVSDGKELRLIASAVVDGAGTSGVVASSVPIDLTLATQALARTATTARLVGIAPEFPLVTSNATLLGTSVRVPVPNVVATGSTLAVIATIDTTTKPPSWLPIVWWSGAGLAVLMLAFYLIQLSRRQARGS